MVLVSKQTCRTIFNNDGPRNSLSAITYLYKKALRWQVYAYVCCHFHTVDMTVRLGWFIDMER